MFNSTGRHQRQVRSRKLSFFDVYSNQVRYWGLLALLLGARTLLGAPGIATRSILATSNKTIKLI